MRVEVGRESKLLRHHPNYRTETSRRTRTRSEGDGPALARCALPAACKGHRSKDSRSRIIVNANAEKPLNRR